MSNTHGNKDSELRFTTTTPPADDPTDPPQDPPPANGGGNPGTPPNPNLPPDTGDHPPRGGHGRHDETMIVHRVNTVDAQGHPTVIEHGPMPVSEWPAYEKEHNL